MKIEQPTILIIIGISGDLSVRKLLPALGSMAAAGALPDEFRILGLTRQTGISIANLLSKTKKPALLESKIELFSLDLTALEDYRKLADHLKEIENEMGGGVQRLFYLAVPPQISHSIIGLLGASGLSSAPRTKLLLEKPFGVDLESAKELAGHVDKYFEPDQVYRIDHYLAKEMAQNIIVFRERNSLFNSTWNKQFISSIEIVALEDIGIEGRAIFYEQTGALRDLVQSHLLQLTALVLMDIPKSIDIETIPQLRLAALKRLRLLSQPGGYSVWRGQYRGYQEEVKNPGSPVETFVSVVLNSTYPKWNGVPITLTTGKNLNKKMTEIRINYKPDNEGGYSQLVFNLQPDEGVRLRIFAKRPGYDRTVTSHDLNFTFQEYYANLPEAYEQVLFNALASDYSLFATSSEIIESWRIIDAIQKLWERTNDDLIIYDASNSVEDILRDRSLFNV